MKRFLPLLGLAALISDTRRMRRRRQLEQHHVNAAPHPEPDRLLQRHDLPTCRSIVNGKAAGSDIDIADAVAKQLGSTAQIKTTVFTVIIPALKEKKCDAIISAMTITPERASRSTSSPYSTSAAP